MNTYKDVFERNEKKYRISDAQYRLIAPYIAENMHDDGFGSSTICSLYYDTPTHDLVERSLEKPVYKEKLRIRSYGIPESDDIVFVEIKKKFKGIVYKRRIPMSPMGAREYLAGASFEGAMRRHPMRADTRCEQMNPFVMRQTLAEIEFMRGRYEMLEPMMFVSSQRSAYTHLSDGGLRITFDRDIVWRQTRLAFSAGIGGAPLLHGDELLMEIKAPGALPLDLVHLLDEASARPQSFSKYGNAYKASQADFSWDNYEAPAHQSTGRIRIPELQIA